jgi:hypothetical protein
MLTQVPVDITFDTGEVADRVLVEEIRVQRGRDLAVFAQLHEAVSGTTTQRFMVDAERVERVVPSSVAPTAVRWFDWRGIGSRPLAV